MSTTAPKTRPICPQNIPPDLKDLDQWAGWWWEKREDKWTKPPINPVTGRYARNNDPGTWGSFEAALRCMQKYRLPGVGFMFHADDPFTGVDLDKCRDPETGKIEPWTLEIVGEFDSYTELSPSVTGLHVVVRAALPKGRRRKGRIEMYDRGRFFTVTGHRLPEAPKDVMERTEQLAALHRRLFSYTPEGQAHPRPTNPPGGTTLDDAEMLRRARAAANGEKFSRLWGGDTGGYADGDNEGRSEADLALCSLLAFWTGPDEERVDGLFRQSGLMRPKWDERHHSDGRTYGQGTIGHALAGRSEFWEPPRHPSRSKARRVRGRAAARA